MACFQHELPTELLCSRTKAPSGHSQVPIHIFKRAFTGLAAKRETWQMSALLLLVPLGSFVARAKALPDAVAYELSPDAGNLFAINSTTGIISVQDRFDREVCRTLYYISFYTIIKLIRAL